MTQQTIDVRVSGPNALWVEDKGHDVGAGGDSRIGDLVNDTHGESLGSIFGPGFSEKLPRTTFVYTGPLHDNVSYSNLIGQDRV